MQYAPVFLPDVPPGAVTAGVDWSNDDHAVAVVDAAGRAIERFTVPDTGRGLEDLACRLKGAGVAEIAIERPDGTVVEALLRTGFTVVVISPFSILIW